MSTGQCALALWLVWVNRPAGKQANARGLSILYVFSFFDVGLIYARILFVFFFVRAELFDLFAMIESELLCCWFWFWGGGLALCLCMCFVRAPAAINLYM